MRRSPRELAAVESARAYQIGDFLLLRIAGEKPNGCHFLDLEQSLLDVEPPAFIATWFTPPNVRCILEPLRYEYQEAFRVGGRRDAVMLYHAGGDLSVDVTDLGPSTRLSDDPTEESNLISALKAEMPDEGTEAVGFSKQFDFNEAFRDAIKKIPVPDVPDWFATYTVLEIGAEIGGIAGFNHMFVRVRGG